MKTATRKISKETKDLMDKRREIMKGTPEYNELNKVIRKKTRNNVRTQN